MTKFAFVFPGQGSQSVGMLNAWMSTECVKDTLEEADEALGLNLSRIIVDGPESELNLTANTQPAMLCADVALWRAWLKHGGAKPTVLAGHSLGEYAALVAAEVISFADAIRLVRLRGELMQEAVPQGSGGMAAVIGLDDEAVIQLCAELCENDVLEAVNFNAPGQVVVAGHQSAIERLLEQGKAAGARMIKALPVSVPAHSSLLQPVAARLNAELASLDLKTPQVPVLHNLSADTSADTADLAHAVAQQVCAPVLWVKTLHNMASRYNIINGIECGPGNVLCGLAKRSIKQIPFRPLSSPEALNKLIEEFAA